MNFRGSTGFGKGSIAASAAEGHGFARPENRRSFYAVAEAFLAEVLGGQFEPIGRDFEGSSIGASRSPDHVPGLPVHLKTDKH